MNRLERGRDGRARRALMLMLIRGDGDGDGDWTRECGSIDRLCFDATDRLGRERGEMRYSRKARGGSGAVEFRG